MTHIQLDVVAFLLCLKQIEGDTAGHTQQLTKLKVALNAEMLHRTVVLPIIRQRLILRLSHPEEFVHVELLPLMGHLGGFVHGQRNLNVHQGAFSSLGLGRLRPLSSGDDARGCSSTADGILAVRGLFGRMTLLRYHVDRLKGLTPLARRSSHT